MTASYKKTPSDIKWLVNQLAATQGELDRIDEQVARLTSRRTQLVAERAAMTTVAELLAVPRLPPAPPPVRSHGDYGGRGGLVRFLRTTIESAHPNAVDTLTLADMAMAHFGLSFPNTVEQRRWVHGSLGRALNKLLERGVVVRLRPPNASNSMPSAWRLRVEEETLVALRARVEQAGASTQEPTWR